MPVMPLYGAVWMYGGLVEAVVWAVGILEVLVSRRSRCAVGILNFPDNIRSPWKPLKYLDRLKPTTLFQIKSRLWRC
jgi:hypothetical protein